MGRGGGYIEGINSVGYILAIHDNFLIGFYWPWCHCLRSS